MTGFYLECYTGLKLVITGGLVGLTKSRRKYVKVHLPERARIMLKTLKFATKIEKQV